MLLILKLYLLMLECKEKQGYMTSFLHFLFEHTVVN